MAYGCILKVTEINLLPHKQAFTWLISFQTYPQPK
ncbi:uncharacterized protein G2W53_038348 [Senna tora]|uniref:Uncharacterized protein n=1 Tax=Senna tora TaxID=362788 RepID=A0A834SLW2_9FABA|nr:uncharacterized protein G2W53_038348 [Senna tora]